MFLELRFDSFVLGMIDASVRVYIAYILTGMRLSLLEENILLEDLYNGPILSCPCFPLHKPS